MKEKTDIKITASVENAEQLEAVLKDKSACMCYIDSCMFDASVYSECVKKAHDNGIKLGLRLPKLWRDTADRYFLNAGNEINNAGFDTFLFRNMEGLLFFYENGLLTKSGCGGEYTEYMLDSDVYIFNKASFSELKDMLAQAGCFEGFSGITLPLELNFRELAKLTAGIRNENAGKINIELTVYGRAPMMVSAQCVKKTVSGCDKKQTLLYLKDRTGALMPVKNCCRFCFGTIYNSVPTAVYDMNKEISDIAPDSVRYEFTTETGSEVKKIFAGGSLGNGAFTRGHFKKSVE